MHLHRDEDTIGFAKRYKGHYLLENNVHTSNLDFTAQITEIESDEGDLNVETGPKASEVFETGKKSPTQITHLPTPDATEISLPASNYYDSELSELRAPTPEIPISVAPVIFNFQFFFLNPKLSSL